MTIARIKKIEHSGGRFLFSHETFHELEITFLSAKFDPYLDKSQRLITLSLYAKSADMVDPQQHFTHCRDKRDNKFLDVAVTGNAAALLTGDKDLLVLKEIEGIPIIRMKELT